MDEELGNELFLRVPHRRGREGAVWIEGLIAQRAFQEGLSDRIYALGVPLLLVPVRHLLTVSRLILVLRQAAVLSMLGLLLVLLVLVHEDVHV